MIMKVMLPATPCSGLQRRQIIKQKNKRWGAGVVEDTGKGEFKGSTFLWLKLPTCFLLGQLTTSGLQGAGSIYSFQLTEAGAVAHTRGSTCDVERNTE